EVREFLGHGRDSLGQHRRGRRVVQVDQAVRRMGWGGGAGASRVWGGGAGASRVWGGGGGASRGRGVLGGDRGARLGCPLRVLHDGFSLVGVIRQRPGQATRSGRLGSGAQEPWRRPISSVSCGTTLNRSPTTPKSASSKIGASGSLLITMMVFEVCMPARCWIAPEMPTAR